MTTISLNICPLPHLSDLPLPSAATLDSAGMDLVAAISDAITINPMQRVLIPTGISIALPRGYEAQIRSRSGLAAKYGITVLNSPGTIDPDYRGEVMILLINLSDQPFVCLRGMRIAQMIIAKYTSITWNIVDGLANTKRGSGGLGSTGLE